ncbi:MAG: CTP synthetase [Rhodobacterales bacterium]|nr:MAG: CTP synthetase [Rhodobacterales bacterium]
MLRLALIFHLFIGSTLMGCFMIAALVAGYDTMYPVVISALIGFVVAIPVTYFVAKAVYENG